MDELLKALAEAVRTGSTLAEPALIGYYIVTTVSAALEPIALVCVALVIGHTIKAGMTIYHEKNPAIWVAREKSWAAQALAHEAQRKLNYKGEA